MIPAEAKPGDWRTPWRSEEELHIGFNPILINVVGIFGDLIIATSQVQIAPRKIELGGVADGIAEAGLGIPGVILLSET